MQMGKRHREAANQLKHNQLLPLILKQREADLIALWRGSADTTEQMRVWKALRELDTLAGAIEDAIREHSDSDES